MNAGGEQVSDGEFHLFAESVASRLRIMQWIIGGLGGAIVVFLLAAIPWAMRIESSLTRVTVQMESMEIPPSWFLAKVELMEQNQREQENEIRALKTEVHLLQKAN